MWWLSAYVVLASLVLFGVGQVFLAARLVKALRSYRQPLWESTPMPQVSILLSLRGNDPFLASGLRMLMAQDYPNYELRIVVDSEHDASLECVRNVQSSQTACQVLVSTLAPHSGRCSRKCAALVQLLNEVPETTEVIVLADADLVSHSRWLLELVAPMQDEAVGATHGNRWFWPPQARVGSLVRYCWNAAAVVIMYIFRIPWGGTFAVRTSVLQQAKLAEKWSQAVVEDAPMLTALRTCGKRIEFVPGLMMINQEECTLSYSLDFIKRQLTWTRLYHPNWWAIVTQALTSLGIVLGSIVIAIGCLAVGDRTSAGAVMGALVVYVLSVAMLLLWIEQQVRGVVARRGGELHQFSQWQRCKAILAIPLTFVVHLMATLLATTRRTVTWRGVTYRLHGPWDIEVIAEHQLPEAQTDSRLSI